VSVCAVRFVVGPNRCDYLISVAMNGRPLSSGRLSNSSRQCKALKHGLVQTFTLVAAKVPAVARSAQDGNNILIAFRALFVVIPVLSRSQQTSPSRMFCQVEEVFGDVCLQVCTQHCTRSQLARAQLARSTTGTFHTYRVHNTCAWWFLLR
jgi:hypothetical protein